MRPSRPVLRYHGGKWMLAPWVVENFPPHTVYVEPFGGAASVLMRKPRSSVEVYNDLDDAVVNVFRVLRDRSMARELARVVSLTPWARREFEDAYEHTDDPVEWARRTLVKSFMGFGSSALVRTRTGFRTTSSRNKVRDYADDWANYPAQIKLFAERFSAVTVEHREAAKLIPTYDRADTLFYVDPPYPHSTRSKVDCSGHNGYRFEMTDDDHRTLAELLHSVKGMVVLSGYACDLYDVELFGDWKRLTRKARAQGNGAGTGRIEVLWLNVRAAAAATSSLFAQAGE